MIDYTKEELVELLQKYPKNLTNGNLTKKR